MGLFDDLGKKVSQTSQSLINKANEMADISKLNAQIEEEEKLVKSFYIQLGEKYFQKHGTSVDEEFVQLCKNIEESLVKIAYLNRQLVQTKKIRICPKCGAECDDTSLFCGSCGTELSKKEEKLIDKKYCVNCGQQITAEAVFCPFCGNKG